MAWHNSTRDRDLVYRKIRELAGAMPPNGVIVETGTHIGGMVHHLISAAPSARLFTIDWYQPSQWDTDEIPSLETNQQRFAHWPNVTCIKGVSPDDFGSWDLPIDLLHVDSNYDDQDTYRRNLEFWAAHLAPKGTMYGMVFWPWHFHAHVITEVCFSNRMLLQAMEGMWWAQRGSIDLVQEA